ncbi:MAG: hypothetical protein FJ128_09250 [Deltaproteobacteria bacterium]|nr:hypothetical protein [Deltaproteobacteria bacterium]
MKKGRFWALLGALWFILGGLFPAEGLCAANTYSPSLPLLLLSEENFVWVCYSPYHRTQKPSDRFCFTDDDILFDLQKIAEAKFVYFRTYGLENCQSKIVTLGKSHFPQLKIYLGVSVRNTCRDNPHDDHCTMWQLNEAIRLANAYDNVVGVVVGNECLEDPAISGNDPVSADNLIEYLLYVKNNLQPARRAMVRVTTCFSWYAAVDAQGYPKFGEKIKPYCDVIMINAFPFWAGKPIEEARENFLWAWREIHRPHRYGPDARQGKQIIIGETGWPSQGSCVGSACPSPANEQKYIYDIVSEARAKGIPVFLFEMFDEPWKTAEGSFGPYWGLYDKNGNPKFPLP